MEVHSMQLKSRSASWLLALVPLGLLACKADSVEYFGRWEDTPDGGGPHDAALPDASAPDAGQKTCSPAVAGLGRNRPPLPTGRTPDDDDDDDDDDEDDDDDKHLTPDPRCRSGWRWTGGEHESSLMQPGSDCIDCHSRRRGDAPALALAGTVYGAANEPTDCLGVAGATVRITDAAGQRLDLVSNRAGNFYITSKKARIALPFRAEILFADRTRKMMSAQCRTSCNSCHTQTGQEQAPGRILIP
ncbi:MAG: carboxypeptidase-like regulatory domain-containing protein [Polyangia bacterium]